MRMPDARIFIGCTLLAVAAGYFADRSGMSLWQRGVTIVTVGIGLLLLKWRG